MSGTSLSTWPTYSAAPYLDLIKYESSLSEHCSTGTISTPYTCRAASASVLCSQSRGNSQRFDERTGSVQRKSMVHPVRTKVLTHGHKILTTASGRLQVGDTEARRRQEGGRQRAGERTAGSVVNDDVCMMEL